MIVKSVSATEAHQLWLDAGQRNGHEIEHWEKAIDEVDAEVKTNSREDVDHDALAHGSSSPVATVAAVSTGAPKSRSRRKQA